MGGAFGGMGTIRRACGQERPYWGLSTQGLSCYHAHLNACVCHCASIWMLIKINKILPFLIFGNIIIYLCDSYLSGNRIKITYYQAFILKSMKGNGSEFIALLRSRLKSKWGEIREFLQVVPKMYQL